MEEKDISNVSRTSDSEELSHEYQVRVEKVEEMRRAGIEPWPNFQPVTATVKNVIDEFPGHEETKEYAVAGRVMALREHGKSIFAQIQDYSGRLQIYLKQDVVGEDQFELFKKFIDLGDILWVSGPSFKTRTNEITIRVVRFMLLSKSLHPLPEKFHGLSDVETIYRQRYLDLIVNPESRDRFTKRSAILREMRNYFDSHDFLEVETPMLHPIPGGALAKPFVTHHIALDMDLYLRIAPELYLKRLVIGGFERVYEINRNFRNEGISTRHNPEYTSVEFYVAHHDYHFMMDFIEEMLKAIVRKINNNAMEVTFGQHIVDFEPPFERISMRDSVIKYGQLREKDLSDKNIDETLAHHHIKIEPNAPWGNKLVALFDSLVEPKLIQPTFITHYPIEVSPLAKQDPHDPLFVPRFELFIVGMEFGNGYNELNDPFDQAKRFREQATERAKGAEETHYYDEDYIRALEHGLPPTVGAGIGVDRLVMLLTNASSIKDVILFPTLRKKS